MMHLNKIKNGTAEISDFSGYISSKHDSIINLTRLVVVVSIILAVLMVVSK